MKNNKFIIIAIIIVICFIIGILSYILYGNLLKNDESIVNTLTTENIVNYNTINTVDINTINEINNSLAEREQVEEIKEIEEAIVETDVLSENIDSKDDEVQKQETNNSFITEQIVTTEKNSNSKPIDVKEETKDQIFLPNEIIEENVIEVENQITNEEIEENEQLEDNNVIVNGTVKSIYDYEFDIQAIKGELINIGESMGLTHITEYEGIKMTPSNSSWNAPITASKNFQGKNLEYALKDMVNSMPKLIVAYGGNKIDYFTIYVEQNGEYYTFYFLY